MDINITSDGEEEPFDFEEWVKTRKDEGLLRIERDLCQYLEVTHAATYLRIWPREIGPRILAGWTYDELLQSYIDLGRGPDEWGFYKRMIEIVTYMKDHVPIDKLRTELPSYNN